MAKNTNLTAMRNEAVKKEYRKIRKNNPKWTMIAVIEETALKFFLSPATIASILKKLDEPCIPAVDTVAKYTVNLLK